MDENEKEGLVDKYTGKETLKSVTEKKNLGNIITNDMKNKKNIKNRTDKALGNMNTIVSGLHERPYGSKTFRAAKVM